MTSITVQVPRSVVAPRGAALAAWAFQQAGAAVEWFVGSRSMRAAVRDRATRIVEANRVRRLARSLSNTDPGFAADLYSAADRHELAD